MGRLDGKVAVITGVSQGLGAVLAKMFLQEGAKVVGTARRVQMVEDLVEEYKDIGEMIAVKQDVSKREDWENVKEKALEAFGHVDIIVNNASVLSGKSLAESDEETVLWQFGINTLGVFHSFQVFTEELEKRNGASIVNINSIAGLKSGHSDGNDVGYTISKGGVRALTKHAAFHLSSKKIRVNSIHPGAINTQMLKDTLAAQPGLQDQLGFLAPLYPHYSEPEQIAYAAIYLASNESATVTGAELVVDCGSLTI